jgi:hypothetical protein
VSATRPLLSVLLLLSGCLSHQVTERYYEPHGPGQIEPSPVIPGSGTQLAIANPRLRTLTVRAGPSSRYAMVCVLITPQENTTVDIGPSIIRRARLPTGEDLPRLHDYYQIVFSPHEWSSRETLPKTIDLPTRIAGTRIVGDRVGFSVEDRWLGLSACSEVATIADDFIVEFEPITINGGRYEIPPVSFHAKMGTFTYTRSPS